MRDPGFERVRACHPHWTGFLRLATVGDRVEHEGSDSKGTYRRGEGALTVYWERFAPDSFREFQGCYVHETLLAGMPDLERLLMLHVGDLAFRASAIRMLVPHRIAGRPYEVSLRLPSSDTAVFRQIFVENDYGSPHLPASAEAIVDLGANIGLATVFLAGRYPEARFLCVEPEPDNFRCLLANTRSLGRRVRARCAAVWVKDGSIHLRHEDAAGRPLGAWGAQVAELAGPEEARVPCLTMPSLLRAAGFAAVDILKVDIEGAELELFGQAAGAWLPRIGLLIVETHDRFRPGTEAAVRQAVAPLFDELPRSGQNLWFRRKPP